MKTSNKILLGVLLLPLVLMIFVYSSLYAKLRNNDYITEAQIAEESRDHFTLQEFDAIDLFGFDKGRVEIVYGTAPGYSVSKTARQDVRAEVRDGVLYLKTTAPYQDVVITSPGFREIAADSVQIHVDSMKLRSLSCRLGYGAQLFTKAQTDTLSIEIGNNSNLYLERSASIGVLRGRVAEGATVVQDGASIRQIEEMQLDDGARITLEGRSMNKLLYRQP